MADLSSALGTAGGAALGGPVGAALGGGLGSILGGLFGGGPDYNKIFGQLSPTDVQTLINAGAIPQSALANLQIDPTGNNAQLAALAGMQGVANAQGMDTQSQVALNQALQQTAQSNTAQRNAALQQMAMRGDAGGGAGLAATLAGQQQGAQSNAMAGAQAASDARNRALQAMSASGQMGNALSAQNFQQGAAKAQAQDVLNQWNAANRVGAYGQNWQEQLQKAQGEAGMAPQQYGRATGMGGGIGSVLGGTAGYGAGQGWFGGGGNSTQPASGYNLGNLGQGENYVQNPNQQQNWWGG